MNAAVTRVALVFMAQRINAYLRFGDPVHLRIIDERRRVAEFAAGAIFCRILWQANDFGTTRWELAVMQAMHRGEPMQHVTGVVPGARLLLQAEGGRNVQAVLRLIDAIEAQRIDPADVAPGLRGRIKVAAFRQGLTVADMLRALFEREFPDGEGST